VAAFLSVVIALIYTSLSKNLPSIDTLPVLLEPPDGLLLEPTKLYDRSGEHVLLTLQDPSTIDRKYLRYQSESLANNNNSIAPERDVEERLPHSLVVATIEIADPHFWSHHGFSLSGLFQNTHPTLAQRLVSDLLLYDETPGLRRAIRERLLAAQATSRFGREKILEWYLNSANYGHVAFGADAASLLYLRKSATNLSLGEAALLAGVGESPSLNPMDAPRAAMERQKMVIQELLHYRMITPQEGIQASREKLPISASAQPAQTLKISQFEPKIAPAFGQWVFRQLETLIPLDRLERGGLRIITTLDFDLQNQANCAAAIQLTRLKSSYIDNQSSGENVCLASRLLPTLPIRQENIHAGYSPLQNMQANAVVLDTVTGQILALVGDPPTGFEIAPLPYHPPGSLVTPFVYLAAFARGSSPGTLVWDIPSQNPDAELQNIDKKYHGPIRLRIALANDYLVPAEQVFAQVGSQNVLLTAQQFGIVLPGNPDYVSSNIRSSNSYSLYFGSSNSISSNSHNFPPQSQTESTTSIFSLFRPVNLVEIARAFNILANQGVLVESVLPAYEETNISTHISSNLRSDDLSLHTPPSIIRVEDASGRVWLDWSDSRNRPIITSQLAYLMTDILGDEAARWQSMGHPNALEIGRPAAAKIGRTPFGDSNWTVGYTPQRVVGIWIGGEKWESQPEKDAQLLLREATTGLWHALIQYASRELPNQTWDIPANLSNIKVCDPSGMLPTRNCPNVVDEIFLPGNEPLHADTLYRTLQVNRETGNMATLYTPPDLVEERTYLMFPPEASQWAHQAGLDIPPEAFDIVPAALPGWSGARIDSPAMFALVRGRVVISGDAGGDDFDYYRIQVGEGLFPESWLQVGEDITRSVSDGTLATWDTTGLSGLYAIQLLVVRKDQGMERITTMVTVDNQPPEVEILYPVDQEEISISQENTIVLQTRIIDEIGIKEVLFNVDGRPFATLTQSPYAISWKATLGIHTLQVQAIDLAGNISVAKVDFVVQ
jgi:membrane peptidoglycan carboxypeptidase